ncbi:MAG: dihydroneopterin aldolase [Gemmatimonadaceae bacterium]
MYRLGCPFVPISYEVSLRGMRFHARVGVLAHEREFAQPIEIDATVWQSPIALAAVAATPLDYRHLHDHVAAVMSREPIGYLETIVTAIAERVLANDAVDRVRVAARKPHVTLPGDLLGAEVVVDVRRDG